ncbi:MAG: hypothetical protein DI551_05430 [Micavibrio aeruginosavorus]|uniref:Uncharacterized protein n=1 Tax=Micavibrio aeruginosavorus TaxID=349221 RepID=A0A2W5MYJ9_9BACT|nr:MAG: hypothetical protein DI551_05430 [Micavibrio aeruginosavorus]
MNRLKIYCIAFLLALSLGALEAYAQDAREPAEAEDVAIAFFKTAGTNPDFELWAKNSLNYKTAPPRKAALALDTEKQRLMHKWRDYNPEEDVLEVRAKINVELKATTNKEGSQSYWMYLLFDAGEVTYLPYEYQQYKFAIIPERIESLMIQPIQREQFDLIQANLKGETAGKAYLDLQLKPSKAYINQPYIIDDTEQWALLADVAAMSLRSREKGNRLLWTYGAEWYTTPQTQELRDLYQRPGEASTSQSPLSIP